MLQVTNNTDILFDDLAVMRSKHVSGNSADSAIQYGDCGNRFDTETVSSPRTNNHRSAHAERVIAYGDCGN